MLTWPSSRSRGALEYGAAGCLAFAALLTFAVPAKSQVPGAFRPNAGTIINTYAPPADALVLPSSTLPKPADEITAAAAPGTKVLVYSFELEGVTLLPQAEVEAQLAELIGQKVSLDDLRKAAARVTALYRKHGYFLARAYVPAQTINGGGIRIAVLEGRYDHVETNGSARLGSDQAGKTLLSQGIAADQPIEEKSLERSLILLEQKAGAPANAVLRPGASIGTSSLQVNVPEGPLFSGSLGADSYGNRYTGEQRGVASVHLNSPLGMGDAGELWAAYSTGARALFASYQLPLGHRGFSLGASYADYHYELCCEFQPLERAGDARVAGLQARYPLLLRQSALLNVGLGYQHKSLVDNWAEGDLADRTASVATVDLDGLAAGHAGQVRYQVALTSGNLKLNGPSDFITINDATIDTAGHYSKLWGQVELFRPVSDGSFLSFRLSGQLASRNLDSSEKFLLGGYNGVRAYPEGEAAGDEALLARLEWIRPLNFTAMAGKAALHVFVDGGTTWIVDDLRGGLADPGIPNHYSIGGAGLGFNWNISHGLSLNAYVATKIGNNPGRSANGNDADGKDGNTRGWFGMEWAF
jgi:hemolysin activation/secretion protein